MLNPVAIHEVLTDAVTTHNSNLVHTILFDHEYIFPLNVLNNCLMHFVSAYGKLAVNNPVEATVEVSAPFPEQLNILYMLLDAGANINYVNKDGNTCLFYAVLNKDIELCDILLQCGADMWAKTEHCVSIYHYVSQMIGSEDLIKTFNKFYPGLWEAVESENIYQVRHLINFWCRTNLQKDGMSLKDVALQTGNEEIISLIFGVWESMELIYHIFARNTLAVKRMLESNRKKLRLNLRKLSDHGAPILFYLIQSKNVPILELFMQHNCQIYTVMQDHMGNDMPVLFSALKSDIPQAVVEALLPQSKTHLEDILHKMLYKGKTLLEVALENNVNTAIFKILVDRGGPLLLCDRNQFNETIQDIAEKYKKHNYIQVIDECISEWIQNPLDYQGRREKLVLLGWSFKENLCMREKDKVSNKIKKFLTDLNSVQVFIENSAATIEFGNVSKFKEMTKFELEFNVDMSDLLWHGRPLGSGLPLLHLAVLWNKPEIVEIILKEKPIKESIDNLFDHKHRTALHYAFASASLKKIQNLLLNYGCSEHVLDKMNREPLDFKEKQDTSEILHLIQQLKDKNFSEVEPDPWNTCIDLKNTPNSFFKQKDCDNNEKTDLYYSYCNHNHNAEYNAVTNEKNSDNENYKNYSEEASDDEDDDEESNSTCLIS